MKGMRLWEIFVARRFSSRDPVRKFLSFWSLVAFDWLNLACRTGPHRRDNETRCYLLLRIHVCSRDNGPIHV